MTYMMKKHTTTFQFRPDGIKSLLLMLLLLVMGAHGAWGETDHSGTYFIANGNGYSSTNAASNFYLVPATNANYATDQPHLTTSKTGQVLNCCWRIVKSGDYYRIIHVADGKYLTANPAMDGTSGNDVGRLRVHLQEFADIAADTDGNTLFEIKVNSNGGYNIRHKDMADKINNSTTTYLDPAGGNVYGTNLTSVRTASTSNGKVNVGGGIGYWTDEPAARWRFEEVPQNNTYTYNIVDCSGRIAIKYTTGADQPAAKALSSYTDIPAAIRSPYLNGETVKFYTFSGAFDADNLTDENKIAATPVADNANIYVTYTTDHLSEKFLRLRGARAFNIVTNGEYAYDNGGTLEYDNTEANKTQPNHLWNISGGDPYAVQIKNLGTHKYLVSSTMPTLSLAGTATNNFILMEQSAAADAGSESVMLMKATGTEDLVVTKAEFQASPVNITTKYYLIDKAGKLIQGNIESESSELGLPDEWRSPLVSEYHYYKTSGYNETTQTYTPADPITSPFEAGADGNIYVTYDVSDAVDLTGGKTYLLKFSGGEYFHQEDGHDGINKEGYTDYGVTSATKAIYPYNNGDFNLYVYGQEQWEAQLASGASTRSRWLWYIISSHDGTPLTGNDIDPYHVVIKSYQNHTVKDKIDKNDVNSGDKNYGPGSSYLQTYKPSDYASVITNIAYENENYSSAYNEKMPTSIVNGQPTEYMILGTSIQNMTLKTFNEVEGERRTVNSFEQYWKNNPTVKTLAGVANPAADNATLTEMGWHQFTSWAYSAPWDNSTKGLAEGTHWYQTISMGSGNFTVEEVSLTPQVILLDQHGWEIMRMPMYTDNDFTVVNTEGLSKYNSPMVSEYQWYPSAAKVTGYHKYNISDPAPEINIYENSANPANNNKVEWHIVGSESFTSNSLAVTPDGNLTGYSGQDKKYKTDFYVTYTVKSQYANAYHGAATEDAVTATPYLLKQGGNYATYGGSGTTIGTVATKPSRESLTNDIQWYLKPNFNIDREMGYKYAGETGAQDDALSKDATEAAYMTNGQNGFDPYNVQIQNRAYPLRYFTANTTGSALSAGLWTGTSGTVALQNISTRQTAAGYDQTTLNITNATFMVVDDGAGNMRLMPRFDHSKVMQSFGTIAAQAAAASPDDEGTGSQTLFLESVAEAKEIHSSDEMTDPNGYYLLAEDFTFASDFTSISNFTGVIDGQLHTISGLSHPFIVKADGAIIKNVILDNVTISSGDSDGNTGAIACVAKGTTRIYNCGVMASNSTVTTDEDGYTQITSCSSTISGSGYTGGLVGKLDEEARVINCYSYADITGGTTVGGIVGYNNVATTSSNLKTMVMNCMFYGDITGGTNKAPIYNGTNIVNRDDTGVSNFNYFWGDASYVQGRDIDTYNCALMAETRFLQRFEFFRHLLNGHRELAAWWATGSMANKDQMMKWVMEPSQIGSSTPYPILKTPGYYPSVVNIDAKNATIQTERNKGGKLGTLTVNIQMGSGGAQFAPPTGAEITTPSLKLNITDKDPEHFNFNYYKVQLPYYNDVGTGNYTKVSDGTSRVVTGWKIVNFHGGGTAGIFTNTGADVTFKSNGDIDKMPFNFADRNCTNKDYYGTNGSNRVFNQGAYFDVPEGVSEITIEPYWAKAVFLTDAYADVVYNTGMGTQKNIANVGGGKIYSSNGGSYTIDGESKTVYTSIGTAVENLAPSTSHTVNDYAVVLVGNYHFIGVNNQTDGLPYTLMSADFDHDNEPDYSYILRFNGRVQMHPVKVDFLNIPGLGMAQKSTGGYGTYNLGIPRPLGWFEVTNTALFRVTQMEYERSNRAAQPIILHGGVIEQWVSAQNDGNGNKTTYFHVGSNVWFKEFHLGCHIDQTLTTKHPPVSVTGGDYNAFYLTGLYSNAGNYDDNAECYINGGRFGTVAGTGMEGIGNNSTHANGHITWQIDNADIENFYGGGINAAKIAEGNINTIISNSHVGVFCGGPQFGDMNRGRTVKTTATGCNFGTFFGAGYGGNSYYTAAPANFQNKDKDPWNSDDKGFNLDWDKWIDGTIKAVDRSGNYTGGISYTGYHRDYITAFGGVSSGFTYEFLPMSNNDTNVARLFLKFVKFSLATTRDVTSTLTKCIITGNFYGGGRLGKVDGPVTSVLTDCEVHGNVFGAGFSAELPTVDVMQTGGFKTQPYYDKNAGVYLPGEYKDSDTYTWVQAKTVNDTSTAINTDDNILYTTENLDKSNLGSVAGNVTLTIKGNSVIGTAGDTTKGNVFGGGEQSYVTGATNKVTVNIEGNTQIYGNVFGGGDEGDVEGSAEVNIRQTAPTTTDPEP